MNRLSDFLDILLISIGIVIIGNLAGYLTIKQIERETKNKFNRRK